MEWDGASAAPKTIPAWLIFVESPRGVERLASGVEGLNNDVERRGSGTRYPCQETLTSRTNRRRPFIHRKGSLSLPLSIPGLCPDPGLCPKALADPPHTIRACATFSFS